MATQFTAKRGETRLYAASSIAPLEAPHPFSLALSPYARFTLGDSVFGLRNRRVAPKAIQTNPEGAGKLLLTAGDDGEFSMNDWSFGQLSRLAGVSKETVNRLSSETASRVFAETLPRGNKPLQLLTTGDQLRSIHGTGYIRLFDADLLSMVREFATDFEAPPEGMDGGTGLYAVTAMDTQGT